MAVLGAISVCNASNRSWMASASSSGRTIPWPVRPCLSALRREIALPSAVRGPAESMAFWRLASIRAWVVATACGPIEGD